ncbi:MAG: hypothetical protein NTX00_00645 [Candidatus Parcubacteria bacterium]|nr:hypothetical protein [Candidatus Parcubacteria bacterium]
MTRLFIVGVIGSLILMPFAAWASPGPLDQYGGHECLRDCQLYGLEKGQYHYHEFPNDPNYLAGDLIKPKESYVFFQPALASFEVSTLGESILVNNDYPNTLVKGIGNDQYYCKDKVVFGKGLYDDLNRARIKPVCAENENLALADTKISPKSYYKEVSTDENNVIKKVYHFEIHNDNKKVFTDFIPINELKGLIIKGETDKNLYYINRYDDPLSLRSISAERASFYGGADYQTKIVYISDSLIYSYKIGQPIY